MLRLADARNIVFDLDGTLYRTAVPLEKQIVPAIWQVAAEILQTTQKEAADIVRKYNDQYEYCVFGFAKHHNVTAEEFIERTYKKVDRSQIHTDPQLASIIQQLAETHSIFVLTNSGFSHASDVLARLGIERLITEIFSIEKIEFRLKPHRRAYQIIAERVASESSQTVYFDDSVRNIQSAWRQGFKTVLVSNGVAAPPLFYEMHICVEHAPPSYADSSTHDLVQFLKTQLNSEGVTT